MIGKLTFDRTQLESADSVVIHMRDFDWLDVPENKFKNQKYVLLNQESPCYSYLTEESIDWFDNHIDWHMSYRTDSDIYAPYAYKRETEKKINSSEFKYNFQEKDKNNCVVRQQL